MAMTHDQQKSADIVGRRQSADIVGLRKSAVCHWKIGWLFSADFKSGKQRLCLQDGGRVNGCWDCNVNRVLWSKFDVLRFRRRELQCRDMAFKQSLYVTTGHMLKSRNRNCWTGKYRTQTAKVENVRPVNSDVGVDTDDGIACADDGDELAAAAVAADCCEVVWWCRVMTESLWKHADINKINRHNNLAWGRVIAIKAVSGSIALLPTVLPGRVMRSVVSARPSLSTVAFEPSNFWAWYFVMCTGDHVWS